MRFEMCIYFAKMTLCKLTGTAVLSPQTILFIYESFVLLETLHWYLKMVTPPPHPPQPSYWNSYDNFEWSVYLDKATARQPEHTIPQVVGGWQYLCRYHPGCVWTGENELASPDIWGQSAMHQSWWQSVSVVLVTVCFSGSGDSLFQWFWW